MADGIRIQPMKSTLDALNKTQLTDTLFVVRDKNRPFAAPHPTCKYCGHHEYYTYHLQLDSNGTTIVSKEIWEKMLNLFDHGGFEKVNVVSKPPTQTLTLPTAGVGIVPAQM